MEREGALVLYIVVLENIRNEIEVLVVADEPHVGVDHHYAEVALVPHQHADLAAWLAARAAYLLEVDDARDLGDAALHGRKFAGRDVGREHGGLDHLAGMSGAATDSREQRHKKGQPRG